MALAIWIATCVDAVKYLGSRLFLYIVIGAFAAALLCGFIRFLRRASLADIYPSLILDAWFLVRFIFIPAVFVLAIFWLLAWVLGLGFTGALGEATMLTLLHGTLAILLTSAAADLAAAIKGPGRAPPGGG